MNLCALAFCHVLYLESQKWVLNCDNLGKATSGFQGNSSQYSRRYDESVVEPYQLQDEVLPIHTQNIYCRRFHASIALCNPTSYIDYFGVLSPVPLTIAQYKICIDTHPDSDYRKTYLQRA